MQDVNPDMDDLFKQAADEYPLKTNTADWETISQKLYTGKNKVTKKQVYNERKWALLSLLLLIPIGLIVTQYYKAHKEQAQTVANIKDKEVQSLPLDKKAEVLNKTEPGKQINNEIKEKINSVISKKIYSGQRNDNISMTTNEVTEQKKLIPAPELSLREGIAEQNNLKGFYIREYMNDDALKNKSTSMINNNQSEKLFEGIPNNIASAANNTSNQKNIKQRNNKLKRFYIGGLMAPEFTVVKFQPVKKAGFDMGILIGYDLSDKFSLELGAVLAHKYYYTDGKYIAPQTIRRDNLKILDVNAFNSITEIPLTLQYNIKNEKNIRFFASAGCVSYVIHKEHYDYTYTKNGEEKQSIKYRHKASDNWFSSVQVSVGYEYAVKKIANIRIEPYYRIPLQGIGISDLPITSIGINFALTKSLK